MYFIKKTCNVLVNLSAKLIFLDIQYNAVYTDGNCTIHHISINFIYMITGTGWPICAAAAGFVTVSVLDHVITCFGEHVKSIKCCIKAGLEASDMACQATVLLSYQTRQEFQMSS